MKKGYRNLKKNLKIAETFHSTDQSLDEMVKAFKDMEACFEEDDLGLACYTLGLKLDSEDEDPKKILPILERALKIFTKNENIGRPEIKWTLAIAATLRMLGTACSKLNRNDEALGYLNWSLRVWNKLEDENSCTREDILLGLYATHQELFTVKFAMGNFDESVFHLNMILENQEKSNKGDSAEVGRAYHNMCNVYMSKFSFQEALPYGLKALEIYIKHFGDNSDKVGRLRKDLWTIYNSLHEHDKAMEQNLLAMEVSKNLGSVSIPGPVMIYEELTRANMLIGLGKYKDAIEALDAAIPRSEKNGQDRALVYLALATAFTSQEKFSDGKRYLKMAGRILDKKEAGHDPYTVACILTDMSTQYEKMNQFNTAMLLLKRVLSMPEKLPQKLLGIVSAKIIPLIPSSVNKKQQIPIYKDVVERMKEVMGPKSIEVGCAYVNMGCAYGGLGRMQSAAQCLEHAKEIMDVSLGPHHLDSLRTEQTLAGTYARMGRFPLAIDMQEKVIEGLKALGPSEKDNVQYAVRTLDEIKEIGSYFAAKVPPQSKDGENNSESSGSKDN